MICSKDLQGNPKPQLSTDRTEIGPGSGHIFKNIFGSGRVGEFYFGSVQVGDIFFTGVWNIFPGNLGINLNHN